MADKSKLKVLSIQLLCRMVLVLVVGYSFPSEGHDTGFGHSNRTLAFTRTRDGLRIEYRIQVPDDECLVELTHMDRDRDGRIAPQESDAFFSEKASNLLRSLYFRNSEGIASKVNLVRYSLGLGNTQTFIFDLPNPPDRLVFEDRFFIHKAGSLRLNIGAGLQLERPLDDDAAMHTDFLTLAITLLPPTAPLVPPPAD